MDGACNTQGSSENTYKLLIKKLKGRYHLEVLGVEEIVIVEWIVKGTV
jgi:hypothetical protein